MDPSLVVSHLDQTAEHTHAMIDMDDVITYIKGA